jgi:long-chain acyl-CoA synthetase
MADYPWFAHYPSQVSQTVEYKQYNSLPHLLEQAFGKYATQTAYESMGKTLTYKEVNELSHQFAAFFQKELGLKKGDRIAIQMPNCLQYPVVMFGALRAGLVVVNTNPLYTPREMKHQFTDAGVKALVIIDMFAHNLEKILGETNIEHVIVTGLGDMLGTLKGSLVNFVVKNIKKMVPAYSLPKAIPFKKALSRGSNLNLDKVDISPEDLAFLQYTGGTTGVAKGAMLSHRNMIAHTLQIEQWFQPLLQADRQERMVTAIPLYHIFALAVNGIFMAHIGAENLLITNPRDMKTFLKELKKKPFTLITGVNTLFNGLLNQPSFKEVDFSELKTAIGGGMAVQKAVAEKWKQVTGVSLVEGYGLSETAPVLSVNPLDGKERQGTIGLPMPNTEMAIFDEEGNQLGVGEVGEICARGPQVMRGYWQRDDETKKVFFGEFFRTGDIGTCSADGYFKIVDRKKDMINVSGFNVYPNEVEDAVAMHPKVLECAAVGVADEKSTEAVKLFVVKKEDSLTADELKAFCRENLTAYKVPKYIEWRRELPKSNVGKILRRVLREEEDLASK